tara:strand:+ start:5097 stop:6968 length:1872 start_codon:yes stop_codon:yes gene_type:complete
MNKYSFLIYFILIIIIIILIYNCKIKEKYVNKIKDICPARIKLGLEPCIKNIRGEDGIKGRIGRDGNRGLKGVIGNMGYSGKSGKNYTKIGTFKFYDDKYNNILHESKNLDNDIAKNSITKVKILRGNKGDNADSIPINFMDQKSNSIIKSHNLENLNIEPINVFIEKGDKGPNGENSDCFFLERGQQGEVGERGANGDKGLPGDKGNGGKIGDTGYTNPYPIFDTVNTNNICNTNARITSVLPTFISSDGKMKNMEKCIDGLGDNSENCVPNGNNICCKMSDTLKCMNEQGDNTDSCNPEDNLCCNTYIHKNGKSRRCINIDDAYKIINKARIIKKELDYEKQLKKYNCDAICYDKQKEDGFCNRWENNFGGGGADFDCSGCIDECGKWENKENFENYKCDNNFEGCIISIKGDNGSDGKDGDEGYMGMIGKKGDRGRQGLNGKNAKEIPNIIFKCEGEELGKYHSIDKNNNESITIELPKGQKGDKAHMIQTDFVSNGNIIAQYKPSENTNAYLLPKIEVNVDKLKGEIGDKGIDGKCYPGESGKRGVPGSKGRQGEKGDRGRDGEKGPKGMSGPTDNNPTYNYILANKFCFTNNNVSDKCLDSYLISYLTNEFLENPTTS